MLAGNPTDVPRVGSSRLVQASLLFVIVCPQPSSPQTVTTVRSGVVGDDMEMGPDGMLYTTHYTGTALRRINVDGDVTIVRDGMPTLGAIAVDADDGTIFVTNYDEGWVMSLGRDGMDSDTLATGLPGPAGIEVDRDGNLLVAVNQAHAIVRIRREGGEPEVVFEGEPLNWPTGFGVADDGSLWIAEHVPGRSRAPFPRGRAPPAHPGCAGSNSGQTSVACRTTQSADPLPTESSHIKAQPYAQRP